MSSKVEKDNRFDYNQVEYIKFRKELDQKKKQLLEKGRPEIKVLPSISFKTICSTFIAIAAISFTWFIHYPEPPFSPILFQWQSLGHKFNYKGYDIFYIDTINANLNNKNEENLFILHGFPTSSFDFHLLYPNLTKIFHRTIAPDFLGFGFSSKPRSYSYSIMDQTDMVISLIESLKLDSVHLFAHDYGDSVAQELLARNQEGLLKFKLKSVCMMNGGVLPAIHQATLGQRLFRIPILRTVLSKFVNFPLFSRSLNHVFGKYTKASFNEMQDFWKLIRLRDGYRVWPELLTYIDERLVNENRWIDALKTTVPFYFIYGPADPVNPSPIFQQILGGIVGEKHLTVLPTHIGHYPHIEAAEAVIIAYMSFIEAIPML